MLKKKEVVKVIDVLEETYPDAKCALDYGTLYQLLVSVILSAQTTDVSVNKATPALFAAAPDAESMVKLSEASRLKSLSCLLNSNIESVLVASADLNVLFL